MLKEEKELRNWIDAMFVGNLITSNTKLAGMRSVSALVRAVREECAKVAERTVMVHDGAIENNTLRLHVSENVATAIRRSR